MRRRNGRAPKASRALQKHGFQMALRTALAQQHGTAHARVLAALGQHVVQNWSSAPARNEAFAVFRDACLDAGYDPLPLATQKRDRVLEAFPHLTAKQAKQVRGIMAGSFDPVDVPGMESRLRQMYNRPRDSALRMMALDILLEGFGVESILLPFPDRQLYVAEYVNTGDTYSATILFETQTGKYRITTWGDWLEAYERKHNIPGWDY